MSLAKSILPFAGDIKIVHSVFALPFAASAFWLARLPVPSAADVALLLVAMVAARTFAMGINRLIDARIDAQNSRTSQRAIPAGRLTRKEATFWIVMSALVFVASAFALNIVAGWCSFGVLAIFFLYPYWKNFSWGAHWYLGLCLGLSPVAVGVALHGRIETPLVLLGVAVMFWTAGFDILYALQDLEFDRAVKLRSVPIRFGIKGSLVISQISFSLMLMVLGLIGYWEQFGSIYFFGVAAIGAVLVTEHLMVRDVLSKKSSKWLPMAFFHLNALVSFLFLGFCLADFYWR